MDSFYISWIKQISIVNLDVDAYSTALKLCIYKIYNTWNVTQFLKKKKEYLSKLFI